MVDSVNTYLLFPQNLSRTDALSRVLDLLENEPQVAPTHASGDERKRIAYDRNALLKTLTGNGSKNFHLWRSKTPKYTDGYLSANDATHNRLIVDYTPGLLREGAMPELFATWTRLAEQLKPDFGFVHLRWKLGVTSEEYNRFLRVDSRKIRDFGFRSFAARNWFGPDLVSLIGLDRLLTIENTIQTSWGGVQLDLLEKPWLATFEQLAQRQVEVKQIFAGWGLIANYSDLNNTIPAPNWTPRLWKV